MLEGDVRFQMTGYVIKIEHKWWNVGGAGGFAPLSYSPHDQGVWTLCCIAIRVVCMGPDVFCGGSANAKS